MDQLGLPALLNQWHLAAHSSFVIQSFVIEHRAMSLHRIRPPSLSRAVFLDRDGVINRALEHDRQPYPPTSLARI